VSKRQIKKRILAEAMKLYREHHFETKRFTMRAVGGNAIYYSQLVHVELREPHHMLTDLMHECGRLEGERP
jgi:hypothetical protein